MVMKMEKWVKFVGIVNEPVSLDFNGISIKSESDRKAACIEAPNVVSKQVCSEIFT